MQSERRRAPRYPLLAAAEVAEAQSETWVTAQTSDLSLYGCYLDMLNPLPVGTQVKLKITHQNVTFESSGRVVQSQPNMGMGVVFGAIEPRSQALLQKWLAELSGD